MSPNSRTRAVIKIETFQFPDRIRVEFAPVKDVPGFSHVVWLLYCSSVVAKDWFAPHPHAKYPSKRAALYYYDKHKDAITAALDTRTRSVTAA